MTERNLGKIIDNDVPRGQLVEVNGKIYLEANSANDLRVIMGNSDDTDLPPLGLDDSFAERHTTYGDLRRAVSGYTVREQDSD